MARRGLKFGIFLAPFHRLGENPTLGMARDLELIEWLDELGYDEAWVGEHHSAGWETIASPEIFIGVAADRTKHIKHDENSNIDNDRNKTVGNNQTETIVKNKTIDVGENHRETIGKNVTISVGENHGESIGKNMTISIANDLAETVEGKYTEAVTKEYGLTAKTITMEADDKITLKTGDAQMVMKSNGDITISGKTINIKGSGDVIIKGSKVTAN